MIKIALRLAAVTALLYAAPAVAQEAQMQGALSSLAGDGKPLSLSLQVLLLMSLLTILPSLVLMMTSFTRVIIVLSILRQALGLQNTPPNQVLVGLALFLSMFVMQPQLSEINKTAVQPYMAGTMPIDQGIKQSGEVFHSFMIKQTRKTDLLLFADLANAPKFKSPKPVSHDLYVAVATVLAFVFNLDAALATGADKPDIDVPDNLRFDASGRPEA